MPAFFVIVFVSIFGLFLGGCGGIGEEEETLVVEPIEIPAEQKSLEDDAVKDTYLDEVLKARAQGRDCGHYEVDSDGDYVLDENGSKITVHDGSSDDWRDAVPDDPLAWNDALYHAAYEHSQDMPSMGKDVTHEGSGGPTDHTAVVNHLGRSSMFEERALTNGYTYAKLYEDLTAGTDTDTPEKAVEAWLNSAGHCKDVMDPEVTEMGMSHVHDAEGYYVHYWTLELGKPAAEVSGFY